MVLLGQVTDKTLPGKSRGRLLIVAPNLGDAKSYFFVGKVPFLGISNPTFENSGDPFSAALTSENRPDRLTAPLRIRKTLFASGLVTGSAKCVRRPREGDGRASSL